MYPGYLYEIGYSGFVHTQCPLLAFLPQAFWRRRLAVKQLSYRAPALAVRAAGLSSFQRI